MKSATGSFASIGAHSRFKFPEQLLVIALLFRWHSDQQVKVMVPDGVGDRFDSAKAGLSLDRLDWLLPVAAGAKRLADRNIRTPDKSEMCPEAGTVARLDWT